MDANAKVGSEIIKSDPNPKSSNGEMNINAMTQVTNLFLNFLELIN